MVERNDRRARTRESGTSIVEMAIVLPLLLVVVFAIGEFGIAYTQWVSLTNAAREGARVGVVYRNPCNAGTVNNEIVTTVTDFAERSGLDGAAIATNPVGACLGTGTELEVTATVPFNYLALPALAGLAPTVNLSARTVMRNE
jgi:Flp pilus assembly protein TadG